jgi:hypothetical protein
MLKTNIRVFKLLELIFCFITFERDTYLSYKKISICFIPNIKKVKSIILNILIVEHPNRPKIDGTFKT